MKIFGYIATMGSVLIADRVTKLWALTQCTEPHFFNSFFSCELTFNRGISWGLFHTESTTVFLLVSGLISMITCGLFVYTMKRYQEGHAIFGEVLVISGSISNIYDRVVYNGVIDFVELSYQQWVWPSFNAADACIVLGVCIMFVQQMRTK